MKKRIPAIGTIVFLILSFAVGVGMALEPVKLFVNGKEIQSNPTPVIIDGRVMVPMRVVAETLGAKVEWDDKNRAVRVSVKEELPRVKINGEITTWPYWIKDGRLYLERRNAVQLVREGLRHPEHSIAYFPGDSSLTINGKKVPLGVTREGEYQIVNVEYLRDLGIVNFAWDAQDENIVILPRQ